MNRRTFLYLTLGTLAAPPTGEAQQTGKVYQVGLLVGEGQATPFSVPLRDRLRDLGYRGDTRSGSRSVLSWADRNGYPNWLPISSAVVWT